MATRSRMRMGSEDIAAQLKRQERYLRGNHMQHSPADFHNSYLCNEDFSGRDLSNVRFYGAELIRVNFSNANLTGASFEEAILNDVNFSGANLTGVYFAKARFMYVNLDNANMQDAMMRLVDFEHVKINKDTNLFIPLRCPSSGSFIGWKKALCDNEPTEYYDNRTQHYPLCIVKLLVPEDARRSSAFGEKCRCDKAIILGAYDYETGRPLDKSAVIRSAHSFDFAYHIGDTITIPDFDDNRWNECSSGFHFFIDEESAKDYWW